MTKIEFAQWQTSEVTKELYSNIKERIEEFRELLESSESNGAEHRGIILALREVLGWVPNMEDEDA